LIAEESEGRITVREQRTDFDRNTKWIWGSGRSPEETNQYQAFRKSFTFQGGGSTELKITADSRYVLYLNGERLGQGPVRSWPFDQKYDRYDLTSRLRPGQNTVAILVQYLGVSTFQYIAGRGGLLCEIVHVEGDASTILAASDQTWLTRTHPAYLSNVPRMCCQMGFEEHFDANLDFLSSAGSWLDTNYIDTDWEQAIVLGEIGMEPWLSLSERDIPFLTEEELYPQKVGRPRLVEPISYSFNIDLRSLFCPEKRDANPETLDGALLFRLSSPGDTTITWQKFKVYGFGGRVFVNGEELDFGDTMAAQVKILQGDNLVVVDLCGSWHDLYYPFGIWSEKSLEFGSLIEQTLSFDHVQLDPDFLAPLLQAEDVEGVLALIQSLFLQAVPAEAVRESVFAQTSQVKKKPGEVRTDNLEALCSGQGSEAIIFPSADGSAIELLLDFGREVVGYLEFEVSGEAQVILDLNCFEGIQEGRWLFTEGLNNVLRYYTREGRQFYHSVVRRGFRYALLTLRGLKTPFRIRYVRLLQNTYPTANTASFRCSDYLLNSIWDLSRYTSRLCSEDTYVDCPAYEQAFWVGDARNEALVDYYTSGDYRLSKRCLKLVAASLRRSDLPESQVPSGWQDILTAWSLLWLLACREYYLYSGDRQTLLEIYPAIRETLNAFLGEYLNADDLLEIEAWNMLDWAGMDTPRQGIVTHQNAWLVKALREVSALAQQLGVETKDEDSATFLFFADKIKAALNKHLWSEDDGAFSDCRHVDGKLSATISQQTNTVVYLCGCAEGDRRDKLAEYVRQAPEAWVQIGSPFMMFFSLEALVQQGQFSRILSLIRDNWGLMLDRGATTCWEMFPGYEQDRWTRSHCHAWSAAPGYFLPAYQLGVRPLKPGFAEVLIRPEPVDLTWCQGLVPTPHGEIAVDWSWEDAFSISVTLPRPLPCVIQLPAGIEGAQVETGEGRWEMGAGERLTFRSDSCTQIKLAAQIAKDDHEVEEECDV